VPEGGFYEAVYAVVRLVPRGRVTTYGSVAQHLGLSRGARAVGWALRALRSSRALSVPWHRVVASGGRISVRDGAGMAEQRRRLRAEGVRFRGGNVDMRRHALLLQSPPTRGSAKRSRARRLT
jgi:methylated-DNA-protein-cysteine methyltransferase-like protein